jgi:hypothetical protein
VRAQKGNDFLAVIDANPSSVLTPGDHRGDRPADHAGSSHGIHDAGEPVEVSRLMISARYFPHWTGWDPKTGRLVTASATPDDRTCLLKFDQSRGVLTIDEAFRDIDGQPGFSFSETD